MEAEEVAEAVVEQGNDDDNGNSEGMQNDNGFQNNMMFQGGGDFNQMQMMMAMQNNMGFPMMGMCSPCTNVFH